MQVYKPGVFSAYGKIVVHDMYMFLSRPAPILAPNPKTFDSIGCNLSLSLT